MLKTIGRSEAVQRFLGSLLAGYLRFVQRTSPMTVIPADGHARLEDGPVIITMWHGQHFMQTFGLRPQDRIHVMISRHGDGAINAIAAEKLGMFVVRGSGAQRSDQVRKRGGIQALRQLLVLLEAGDHVSMTADVPKVSRVAGEGIIALAALSGRPILPVATVCSRRIDLKSWDAASIGLPFGRTALVIGEPIFVPPEADAARREACRRAVEITLDMAYAQAYAALGSADPGGSRESVALARAAKAAEAPA
ncbi:MAG: lysophospholipid acyltransferase family protein [Methylobacterium sp.]|jgi:lysophospholipid acyltransferase (LPLAT)-like uncharacterized protein|nr:lysophospholipid acyltransferase family protein [Methylobacterium sp.]